MFNEADVPPEAGTNVPPAEPGDPTVADPPPSNVVPISSPVKTAFKVYRSFSLDESHIAKAGDQIELTAEEADAILARFQVTPIWPVDDAANVRPEDAAAMERLDDPTASLKPAFSSDTHDSVGTPKTDVGPIGPRGPHAMPDSMDEPARKALGEKLAARQRSTVTDQVDSIGNAQVAHDGEGNEEGPHPPNFGPRGANAPKDSFRS